MHGNPLSRKGVFARLRRVSSPALSTRYPDIDYSWRPVSYWDPAEDPLAVLLTNVKGTERRRLIWKHYEEGTLAQLPDVLKEPEVDDATIQFLSSMGGPSFLGGEFLPEYEDGEVEIARISLASVSNDVISIRALPVQAGIGYRVYDEYGAEFYFSPETSEEPLTLGELIGLIDDGTCSHNEEDYGCGLALEPSVGNYFFRSSEEGTSALERLDDALGMTTVSSEFYTAVGEHYDRMTGDWYEAEKRELEEEGLV
jgi:hypothetical protein